MKIRFSPERMVGWIRARVAERMASAERTLSERMASVGRFLNERRRYDWTRHDWTDERDAERGDGTDIPGRLRTWGERLAFCRRFLEAEPGRRIALEADEAAGIASILREVSLGLPEIADRIHRGGRP